MAACSNPPDRIEITLSGNNSVGINSKNLDSNISVRQELRKIHHQNGAIEVLIISHGEVEIPVIQRLTDIAREEGLGEIFIQFGGGDSIMPISDLEGGQKYAFLLEGGIPMDDFDQTVDSLPYAAIVLERSGCFGTCPAYKVRFDKTGVATYAGEAVVSMVGSYTGEITFSDFVHLCNAMEHMNFQWMKDSYEANWTDDSSATVTLYDEDGDVVKSVYDYGRAGPIELWLIQQSIDGIVNKIEWTKVDGDSTNNGTEPFGSGAL